MAGGGGTHPKKKVESISPRKWTRIESERGKKEIGC
jgi:hypothetical protein